MLWVFMQEQNCAGCGDSSRFAVLFAKLRWVRKVDVKVEFDMRDVSHDATSDY